MNCLQFFIFTRFFAVFLKGGASGIGCELLTIFYLYKVLCSKTGAMILQNLVVNCLQFFIFTRFFAVSTRLSPERALLWIAYNFLSLQGSLQYTYDFDYFAQSCELLTIFYLYKVLCSFVINHTTNPMVVNCLQFFIFTRFFAVFTPFQRC